jgi:hypothetical protein
MDLPTDADPVSDAHGAGVRLRLLFHPSAQWKIRVSSPRKCLNPLPSQMCQHQQVFTTLCTCVSIFTIIFSMELATQIATPLDPSTYAKLDRSSGTR